MDNWDIIINGLAVFSIVYLFRYTHGPFDVFLKFREFVGITSEPIYEGEVYIGEVDVIDDTYTAKLFSCFWCLSLWISIIVLIIWNYTTIVSALFAVIGVAGLLYEVVNGKIHG